MASLKRFTYEETKTQIKHDTRTNPGESDIDESLSPENYSLTPGMNIPRSEQYERREEVKNVELGRLDRALQKVYVYNQEKQNITVGTVISLPPDAKSEEAFFQAVADFSEKEIGTLVLAHVHHDEGGVPHIHLLNFPEVAIDHKAIEKKVAMSEARGSKSRIPLALREKNEDGTYRYENKINYDEKIGGVKGRIREAHTGVHEQNFMETFHRHLQEYLQEKGVSGTVVYKPEGSEKHLNIPVALLKDFTARTGREISRETLKDLTVDKVIDALERAHERDAWGRNPWNSGRGDKVWDREY